jgi:hypothetical protein
MVILICGTSPTFSAFEVKRPRLYFNLNTGYLPSDYYCELGGMFKTWKQINTDIVGIEHYRRFFVEENVPAANVILGESSIRNILERCDVIMTETALPSANVMTWMAKEKHNLKESRPDVVKTLLFSWLMYLRDNYSVEFVDFMMNEMLTSNKYMGCNMYISRKALSDKYCEFLFPMLEGFSIDKMHGNMEPRLFGYLSEYVMGYWMKWNEYSIHPVRRMTINA